MGGVAQIDSKSIGTVSVGGKPVGANQGRIRTETDGSARPLTASS